MSGSGLAALVLRHAADLPPFQVFPHPRGDNPGSLALGSAPVDDSATASCARLPRHYRERSS